MFNVLFKIMALVGFLGLVHCGPETPEEEAAKKQAETMSSMFTVFNSTKGEEKVQLLYTEPAEENAESEAKTSELVLKAGQCVSLQGSIFSGLTIKLGKGFTESGLGFGMKTACGKSADPCQPGAYKVVNQTKKDGMTFDFLVLEADGEARDKCAEWPSDEEEAEKAEEGAETADETAQA